MGCVAIGAMFSLAVFLQPMSEATGWSRTGVSSAMTLDFLTMGVAGFGWGALSDRFGPRMVVLAGAVLLGLGLVLASRATSLLEFQLAYGVLVGARGRRFFAPMMAAVTRLVRQAPQPRGLAGLGRHGRGADDDLAARALADHDLRLAHRAARRSALVVWVLLVPAALFVRRPPAPRRRGRRASARAAVPA